MSDLNIYSTFKVPMLGGLFLYQFLRALSFDVELIRHAQLEQEKFEKLLSQGPKVIAISTTLILNPLDIAEVVKTCREKSPDSFIDKGLKKFDELMALYKKEYINNTLGAD